MQTEEEKEIGRLMELQTVPNSVKVALFNIALASNWNPGDSILPAWSACKGNWKSHYRLPIALAASAWGCAIICANAFYERRLLGSRGFLREKASCHIRV